MDHLASPRTNPGIERVQHTGCYLLALALGDVDTSGITSAAWLGLPQFQTPTFNLAVLPMFLPAVIALVAENIGHVFPQHRFTQVGRHFRCAATG